MHRTGEELGFLLLIGSFFLAAYAYISIGMLFASILVLASVLAFTSGILIGRHIEIRNIMSLINGEEKNSLEDMKTAIEHLKININRSNPLAELTVHLEEAMDRESVARMGSAYLIATLPVHEISLEVIDKYGRKKTITTVWGKISKPENSKQIVLQKEDIEGNTLILTITTDEKYTNLVTETSIKVLSIIVKRWNNLIKLFTDPLTGAKNRGYLPILMNKLKGTRKPIAVLMIDLDHFKEVNDTLGHDIGDMVLRETSKRIKRVLRHDDVIIRYGGDEFIIFVRDINREVIERIAERIRHTIESPPIVSQIPVTASIGVAFFNGSIPFDPEKAIKIADNALYKAKEKRNTYYIIEENRGD